MSKTIYQSILAVVAMGLLSVSYVSAGVSIVSAIAIPTDSTPTAITAKMLLYIVFFIFSPITKIYNILHTYNDIFSYLYQK